MKTQRSQNKNKNKNKKRYKAHSSHCDSAIFLEQMFLCCKPLVKFQSSEKSDFDIFFPVFLLFLWRNRFLEGLTVPFWKYFLPLNQFYLPYLLYCFFFISSNIGSWWSFLDVYCFSSNLGCFQPFLQIFFLPLFLSPFLLGIPL